MFFLQGKPNINAVIPAMDFLDGQLTKAAINTAYSNSIQSAIALRKKILNQYYNLTDHSEIYCVAMGMSPELHSFYVTKLNELLQYFILNTS